MGPGESRTVIKSWQTGIILIHVDNIRGWLLVMVKKSMIRRKQIVNLLQLMVRGPTRGSNRKYMTGQDQAKTCGKIELCYPFYNGKIHVPIEYISRQR